MKLPADKVSKSEAEGLRESPRDSAERKRLAARRKLLIGGAASLPVVLTFGRAQAQQMTSSKCDSMGGELFPGQGGGVQTFVCKLFPNP